MKQEHKDFFANRLIDAFAGCEMTLIQFFQPETIPWILFNQRIVKAHFRGEGDNEEVGLEMTDGKIYFGKKWSYPQPDKQIMLISFSSEYQLVLMVTNEAELPGLRERLIQYIEDGMRISGNEPEEIKEYVSWLKNRTAGF